MVATIQIVREADDSLSGEPRTLRFVRRRGAVVDQQQGVRRLPHRLQQAA